MRIRLTGGVDLTRADGTAVGPLPPKRATLLALLALEINRVVTVAELLRGLWGDEPPPTARAALQGHVAALRKMLGGDDDLTLVTRAPGYLLRGDAALVDVHRLDRLRASARSAEDVSAVALLREALALGDGPLLEACADADLREAANRSHGEARLAALTALAERLCALGRGGEVVEDLRTAVAADPGRESPAALLIRCLGQAGRQDEALAVFERAGTARDRRGPGARLIAARDAVLRATAPAVPEQLPRQPAGFAGRTGELRRLDLLAARHEAAPILVTGPAGVGKTSLVLRWAHRNRDRFPDGRLHADLRGFDETEPLDPGAVLARFLRGLGVADDAIPRNPAERGRMYAHLLTGRRVLIVLDNARTADQVIPLLPDDPGCLAVVTSRNRLDDLAVHEGAGRLPLDVLTVDDALDLMGRVVGPERIAAEPAAAERVVALCDRLPLALRIASARLAARPDWALGDLAAEISHEQYRLAALAAGDSLGVAAALSLTCRALPAPAADLVGLLGLHPGHELEPYGVAALAGLPLDETRRLLALLGSAYVIDEARPGRYTRHDLVRLFTRQLAAELPEERRTAAVARLLDHHLAATAAAVTVIRPGHRPHRPERPPTAGLPRMPDAAHALEWFRREEPAVHELAGASAGWGLLPQGCRLVENSEFLYNETGLFRAWEQVAATTLAEAERAGIADDWPHLYSTHSLALILQGRSEEALRQCERAWQLADPAGEPVLRHRYRTVKSGIMVGQGRAAEAIPEIEAAVAAARELGDHRILSQSLNNLAHTWVVLGDPASALGPIEESVGLAAGRTLDPIVSTATKTYAQILHRLGRTDEALEQIDRLWAAGREQGRVHVELDCLRFMGELLDEQGRPEEARPHWQRALELATQQGRPVEELKARLAQG